jgi:hypothetical protein
VPHGTTGRKPRGQIAARNGVDRTIGRRQHQQRIGHTLSERRKDAGCLHRKVGADRENDNRDEARKHGANAADQDATSADDNISASLS